MLVKMNDRLNHQKHINGMNFLIKWFIWLMVVCCVNTKYIILKDEYNATSSISKWTSSGSCSDPWKWSKKYKRWRTLSLSYQRGFCNLETFYWHILEAKMVYVNLTIALIFCDEEPCDDSFNVYVYNDVNNRYEFITKAPTKDSHYDWNTLTFTHTFKLSTFANRVRLKFESMAFWGYIYNISVYYKQCDQVVAGLAAFHAVTAPNDTDPLTVTGKCVANARHESERNASLICFGNGTSKIDSGCTCMKGFRQVNQTCVVAKDSSSLPVKNIVIGLIIGISAAIGVVTMAIYYRFKTKKTTNIVVRFVPSDVQIPPSNEFNNIIREHVQHSPTEEVIYERICQTSSVYVSNEINNQSETQYDVFICYSSTDREWVKNTLLKELESRGKKACIDYRDFLVGAYIVENIVDAIYGSRKTIAVLSPDFLESVYCKQELKTALSRMAHHQVIPILYRTCDVPQSLKDKTYLDWCHDDVKPYFWEHLVKAIDNTSHLTV